MHAGCQVNMACACMEWSLAAQTDLLACVAQYPAAHVQQLQAECDALQARAASDSLPAAPTGSACPTPDLSSPCSSSLSSSGSSSLDAAPAFPPPGLCRPQRMSKVPHAAWSPRGSVEQAAEWEVRIVVGDAEWDVASKYEWRSDSEDEVDLGITRGTSSRGVIICPGSPVHAVVAPRLTGTALEAAVFSHQPNVGQWADCEENEDE